ncbi:hypothetical protein EYF80_017159 [Liparis tanakae]|uniref:Uncharacterized protein n=1 Tax=Liparis tanakae TaxID=230148 RepID=A0A4Z2I5K1_9TELE|nr:hypothetical protein EYF80_017159 [Liparis tanakae]
MRLSVNILQEKTTNERSRNHKDLPTSEVNLISNLSVREAREHSANGLHNKEAAAATLASSAEPRGGTRSRKRSTWTLRLQRSLSPTHSVTHSPTQSPTCSSTCPASKEVSCPGGP